MLSSTIKSVLVGVTEEGKDEPSPALNYALSLAGAAEAHLTVEAASLKIRISQAFLSDYAAGIVSAANRRVAGLAAALAEHMRGEAAAAGVACTVENPQRTFYGLADVLVSRARVHDLCVLDAEEHQIDIDRGLIETVLFESGRPLIVVPPGRDRFAARRALIAWDGSAVAARAVADAMPFLRACDAVEVISVVGEKDLSGTVPGTELAPHLVRHGVNVTVKVVPMARAGVAETLIEQAWLFSPDLIVMGAFKHSRLREWVLGGVTQFLLRNCPWPLFMSH